MILVKEKEKINRIYVPKHRFSIVKEFTLKLVNLGTNKEYEMGVIDEADYPTFYLFSIDPRDLDDGEYKLTLIEGCEIVSIDILRIGNGMQETKHYENNKIIKYYE